MEIPHVQVILDQNQMPGPLRTALNRVKARVSLRSMDKALADGISPTADVCVILPRRQSNQDVLGRILANASERACATMVLHSWEEATHQPAGESDILRRLSQLGNEASLNADELTGRIKALCGIRSPMRQMSQELAYLRRRHVENSLGLRHWDEQLRLAGEIQRDLLPGTLPDTGPLSIETLYLPAEIVSGDIFDVTRLDEQHLGLSIADATGHGLPAALLTIFVRNALRGKEINGDSYTILEPDVVLNKLNTELLEARLSGCQFVTGLHAVFDRGTGQIRWARGGLPYPILLRPGRPPCQLTSLGGLVGAFESPHFEVVNHTFAPGDTLLFFTDGLESLLSCHDEHFNRGEIENSTWIAMLTEQGPLAALRTLREWAQITPGDRWRRDDITVLAVSMNAQAVQ